MGCFVAQLTRSLLPSCIISSPRGSRFWFLSPLYVGNPFRTSSALADGADASLGQAGLRGSELVSLEVAALRMPFPCLPLRSLAFLQRQAACRQAACHILSHQGPASLHGLPSSPRCSLPSSISLPLLYFPLSLCLSGPGSGLLSWSPLPLSPGPSPRVTFVSDLCSSR